MKRNELAIEYVCKKCVKSEWVCASQFHQLVPLGDGFVIDTTTTIISSRTNSSDGGGGGGGGGRITQVSLHVEWLTGSKQCDTSSNEKKETVQEQ